MTQLFTALQVESCENAQKRVKILVFAPAWSLAEFNLQCGSQFLLLDGAKILAPSLHVWSPSCNTVMLLSQGAAACARETVLTPGWFPHLPRVGGK